MAADVGNALRYPTKEGHHRSRLLSVNDTLPATISLITRDLLGQSFSQPSKFDEFQELDLDLQVPSGWQKHLDLKSGKVYLQKCSSQTSRSTTKPLQDTNNPNIKRPLNIMEDADLDLRLVASSEALNSSCTYQSVCTLDAVKSALDRAKHEQLRRMFFPPNKSSSSSSSTSTEATTLEAGERHNKTITTESHKRGLLAAAGCPNCLLYVMISKDNPRCPKCCSTVTLPVTKKPRIDLDLKI